MSFMWLSIMFIIDDVVTDYFPCCSKRRKPGKIRLFSREMCIIHHYRCQRYNYTSTKTKSEVGNCRMTLAVTWPVT
jgi:hypothetical protein